MAKTKFAQLMEDDIKKIQNAPRCVTLPLDGAQAIELSDYIDGARGILYVRGNDIYTWIQGSFAQIVHPGQKLFVNTWPSEDALTINGYTVMEYTDLWDLCEPLTEEPHRHKYGRELK